MSLPTKGRLQVHGRGAGVQPANPYRPLQIEDDLQQVAGDQQYLDERQRPPTRYYEDISQSIVSQNDSPDIGFNYSINPYRGCAHGCSYCYARPTHEYLGLSAGLDFETKVFVKQRAPELFRQWLSRPEWSPEPIAFSGVTDCYQPIERQLELTRGCLETAAECCQPVLLVTKNALVTRDLDLLARLAAKRAVSVAMSITSLNQELTRSMEPRTSSPAAKLRAMEELAKAGVPTSVMAAPIIPGLNDSELPSILQAARDAGASSAAYLLLRLPTTVSEVFLEWLQRTRPDQASKVESFIRSTRSGSLNNSQFGRRHRGIGQWADALEQTFRVFAKKYGFVDDPAPLNCDDFRPPRPTSGQLRLF